VKYTGQHKKISKFKKAWVAIVKVYIKPFT